MTKRLITILLIVTVVVACKHEPEFVAEFVNNSSYTLTISPNGQDWLEFRLASGYSRTVTISESTIYFFYSPASFVVCDVSGDSLIVFYDA